MTDIETTEPTGHPLTGVGVDLTTKTDKDIEPLNLLPCLPKQLCSSLGAMPTKLDIPAPPPFVEGRFHVHTEKDPQV